MSYRKNASAKRTLEKLGKKEKKKKRKAEVLVCCNSGEFDFQL